jgi:hypothetical protein
VQHPDAQPTNVDETAAAQDTPPPVQPLPGFWGRLIAFAIDGIVLGLAGSCLGFFFVDYFASIGGWGRVFGFIIAGVYFRS